MLIDNMLLLLTYPVNFAIYCSMSSQFRETFKRIFLHNVPPMLGVRSISLRRSQFLPTVSPPAPLLPPPATSVPPTVPCVYTV